MTKQTKNLIALGVLIVLTGISYRINRLQPAPRSVIKALAAKAAQQDSPLKSRFHRVRAEMDGLYHYRIKPTPFDTSVNPFHLGPGMATAEALPAISAASAKAPGPSAQGAGPEEFGDTLLQHAIAVGRLGGVVVMNDTTQLTVDGQLHKQGDVFTVKVRSKLVLIRIKKLTTTTVTLALDDPEAGIAETTIRLK